MEPKVKPQKIKNQLIVKTSHSVVYTYLFDAKIWWENLAPLGRGGEGGGWGLGEGSRHPWEDQTYQ